MSASAPAPRRRRQGPTARGPSWAWVGGLAVVIIGGLLWGLTFLRDAGDGRLDAVLRFADTPPQSRVNDSAKWQAVSDGHMPVVGEEIRTTDGMCTALSVGNESSLRLWMDTDLRIESASRARGNLCVRLVAGRIWVDAEPALHVKVVTAVGEIDVSDCAAEIRIDRDKAELLAWRGAARLEGKPATAVGEGHRLVFKDGTPPVLKSIPRKTDVWQNWNMRVKSSLISFQSVPPLVDSSPVKTTGRAPVPPSKPGAAAPVARAPLAPRPRQSARPVARDVPSAGTPVSVVPPPATTSTPSPKMEAITMGPNDPLEKQIADMGTVDIMSRVGKLSGDPSLAARVDKIGQKIVAVCPRASLQWTFRVLETSAPNAMTVGYGRVYVTRGLLELVDDEELAGTLGHEIAHACLRHIERAFDRVQEAMEYLKVAEEARRGAIAVASENDSGSKGLRYKDLIKTYRENMMKAAEALQSAQSDSERWDAEYQADRYGMLYANNAGFRPIGLIDSLEKLLKRASGQESADVVAGGRTHPPLAERIEIARKVYASFFPGR